MARLKSGLNFKDKRDVIGLTICRFPAQRASDGTPIRIRGRVELASTMRCLESATGYRFLAAGRGVDNPNEVLVCSYWVNQESLRDFMQSPYYAKYLQSLGPSETKQSHGDDTPAIVVAEVRPSFLPLWNIATIFTAAFPLSIEPDAARLERIGLPVPYSIYDSGGLSLPRTAPGWIIDPQLEDGRLVKKGLTVQWWAVLEPFEKQLEVYKAVKRDAECRESWRCQVEEMRALSVSVEQSTWDFGSSTDPDDSDSELDQEAELAKELSGMRVQN